jgi:hypothetical protein
MTKLQRKIRTEVCEALVPNWSRLDTRARVATGKCKNQFLYSMQFVETVEYSFIISL